MSMVEWDNRFNIGVEVVDKAHQRLFSIIRKMIKLNEDEEKQRHACRETIKYFKNYTMKHFAEEEAYMRSINYSEYAMHKRLHDNMRDIMLPTLEMELETNEYSMEYVQRFLGICIGWLTGHIMIEDHAITGKLEHKFIARRTEEEITILEDAVVEVVNMVFDLKARLISEHYVGQEFTKGFFQTFTYRSSEGERVELLMAFEANLIFASFGPMLGKKMTKDDKKMLIYAIRQCSRQILSHIREFFDTHKTYKIEKESRLHYADFLDALKEEYPRYSLLYYTKEGCFALCIR